MKFSELVMQTLAWLQRDERVSYRALKLEFDLNDDLLDALREELIEAKRVAIDENGKILVWTGAAPVSGSTFQVSSSTQSPTPNTQPPSGERRQLTVMFIDLVGSTMLSQQLDPEELREVVRAYQETCTSVIRRYDRHIAQHLGDGVLVYFSYPTTHEDDAQRAVRAGLEIITALAKQVLSPLRREGQGEGEILSPLQDSPHPSPLPQGARGLQVRIGIHTGLVVIGEIGSSEKREILALGEAPNIAARVQGEAKPNTVVISQATYHLVQGLFTCEALGPQALKNLSAPLELYRVLEESAAQSRFEAAVRTGLTPLVGRALELGLLRAHWERAKTGAGQVVLLSGEPGIGKSRLIQELKEQIEHDGVTRVEFRCSPYHQNSALYPIIDHLQRLLQFAREDSPTVKLEKLQHTLSRYRFPQADTLPLLAALLSLPHPEDAPPITLSPQKQKQKTQEALVAWIVKEADQAAVYCAWEDLHWADPSTLEVLTLFLDQVPTTRLLAVLTFRPEFLPPWGNRSHLSQMTLSRLGQQQVREMVSCVAEQALRPSTSSGRTESESDGENSPVRAEPVEARGALPVDFIEAVVARTDGVPLFVEELTKTVVETMREQEGNKVEGQPVSSSFPLGVPTTLQDALMARLDRLGPAKDIAQLGAALGREFSYELIHAVSSLDEERLQHELKQLVAAELVYQHGLLPQAHYLFKHALIQDTAYQSLLKSTRQQYHRQIAQVLAERFPETVETQPELVAHHYTEAGLAEQAILYWQRAGERASQRSAYVEAISHFTKGLNLLQTLADTPERAQQELTLQIALGAPLRITKGYAAPEVEQVYTRARALSQHLGETPQLFPVLWGLWYFHFVRVELQTARELGEQCLTLAQSVQDPALLMEAHIVLGATLCLLGELTPAREHYEQGVALYHPQEHRPLAFLYGQDPKVTALAPGAWLLWELGYPDQALKSIHKALTLAQEISHPYSLAFALGFAAWIHQYRREDHLAQERAEAAMALSTEQEFAVWLAHGTILRGWALAEQGQVEEGIAQIHQGLAAYRATGAELERTYYLALLAEAYGKGERAEEGLSALAESLAVVDNTGERFYEAELYRLYGELSLRIRETEMGRTGDKKILSDSPIPRFPDSSPEACFKKAIEIAQQQQAKSLELRATVSLARLWQSQGKHHAARDMLADIYNWFTEGFDTVDLQEAKALLEELRRTGADS